MRKSCRVCQACPSAPAPALVPSDHTRSTSYVCDTPLPLLPLGRHIPRAVVTRLFC
ncbi:hypothetical protein BGX38DRAFT_1198060 [Terfezia claveryi]|nr:hypothetical protein BGX38DRAFT_1198060 [Terfezia claveryi]